MASDGELRDLMRWTRALTILVALLMLGLTVAGLAALHAVHSLGLSEQRAQATEQLRASVAELAERQDAFSAGLTQIDRDTKARLAELHTRRAQLQDTSGGPLKKFDTALQLLQLTDDSILLMLDNVSGLERDVNRAVRPIDAERVIGGSVLDPSPTRAGRTPPNR